MYRGSRKHVLDWTDRAEFAVELLQLVAPVECRISASSQWMPRGRTAPEEARLDTFGPRALPHSQAWSALRTWWLAHDRGANTPNWDIAATCEIEGTPGLILVEAKANVPELSASGKSLEATPSATSGANHRRIGSAIQEACDALRQVSPSIAISRDSHYQLSNRVAFAWKLASLGIPTVMVYLGFVGDSGIADAGAPFTDAAHWETCFTQYAASTVPKDLFEHRLECGAAAAWLLVRTRPVHEASGPRLPNSR